MSKEISSAGKIESPEQIEQACQKAFQQTYDNVIGAAFSFILMPYSTLFAIPGLACALNAGRHYLEYRKLDNLTSKK